MARIVKVKGAAVVLRTADKREGYFYRGAEIPADGFTDEGLKHAESLGLIEVVEVAEESGDAEVELPAGEPTESWTHKQIDYWASKQDPVITFEGRPTIPEKIAAIAAAKQS